MNNSFIKVFVLLISLTLAKSTISTGQSISVINDQLKDSLSLVIKNDYDHALSLYDKIVKNCDGQSIPSCKTDSIEIFKAGIYLERARYYLVKNLDSANFYLAKSKALYNKYNYHDGIIKTVYTTGKIHFKNGTYHEGIREFNRYIEHYRKKNNLFEVARGHQQKASCYRRIGAQDSAIVYLHKAVKVFENLNEQKYLANSYQVMGLVYNELKNYDLAFDYYYSALETFEKSKNLSGQAKILTCIGNNIYSQGDTTGCIPYYRKAGLLNKKVANYEGIFVNFYNTANAFFQLEQYDSSLVYLAKASLIKDKLGLRRNYLLLYKKGTIFIEQGKYDQGISLLKKAYQSAVDLNSHIDARDMAQYLTKGFENTGDTKNALVYSKRYSSLKDSVISIESNRTITEIKTKYESEKKELRIENLEIVNSKQRQGLLGGGIALTLISLLSFFLYRLYNKINNQKDIISKALSEKDLLLREIHHRVKNNLQLVSSLLTLQGDSITDETAQQAINDGQSRVRSMALIHQDLYNKENLTGINVKDYIEKLTRELFYTYKIDTAKIKLLTDIEDLELDVDTLIPMGLILNELITNSLKYAFPDNQTGQLKVSLKNINKQLVLKVQDDGIGYDPLEVRDNSFGATLISSLTAQLQGEIETRSTDGTDVVIKINMDHLK